MKKARFFLPIILFSIMLLTTISISTRATDYSDSHSINTTYQFLAKNNGSGLDAAYGYWQYDGNSPFQVDYNMNLYYLEPSGEIVTYYLGVTTSIQYTNFLGLSRNFSDSDSIGRNSCLAGNHLNGYFSGNSFSRAATSSTTTYISRTFGASLEDNWTITGN